VSDARLFGAEQKLREETDPTPAGILAKPSREPFASPHAGSTIAAFTIVLSSRRIGYVLDGISCVMKTTQTSSSGSTQNAVDAMPPHENSPREAVTP
jgi:hypothetical protein